MFESVSYILSIVILMIVFLLIKKSSKKQNFLLWLNLSFILIFCYNIIIVYILSAVYVHSTLVVLSMVNATLSIILYLLIIRKYGIQQYFIKKSDIIINIICLVIILIIGVIRFGIPPFEIVYETVDPGTHFWTSMDFFRESILLNHADTSVDFSARVFGSYVNCGILLKVAYPFVGYVNLYQIYISYDIFMLMISAMMFYYSVSYIFRQKKSVFISIVTIMYLLGYPLNSMIFGFFYSGHVVTLFCSLILIIKMLEYKEMEKKYTYIFILMLNISICFTYYLYTPLLIVSELIYFIFLYKQSIKKNLYILLLLLGLPLLLTIIYFFIPYFGGNQHDIFYQLTLDGYCYNNWISNFIYFIPLIIYYMSYMFKNKKINFEICLFFVVITFIIFLIILSIFNLAVYYYVSKIFYLLWLLSFILVLDLVECRIINKIFWNYYMIIFLVLFGFQVLNLENKLIQNNKITINKSEPFNIFNIYNYNVDKMMYTIPTFDREEIAIIKELYKIGANDVINNTINSYIYQRMWLNAFFQSEKLDYPENELYTYMEKNMYFYNPIDDGDFSNININYKYYVLFYRDVDGVKYRYYSSVIPYEIQRRYDSNFATNHTVNKKEIYDLLNRYSCENCQFIDFNDGLIIIRE